MSATRPSYPPIITAVQEFLGTSFYNCHDAFQSQFPVCGDSSFLLLPVLFRFVSRTADLGKPAYLRPGHAAQSVRELALPVSTPRTRRLTTLPMDGGQRRSPARN